MHFSLLPSIQADSVEQLTPEFLHRRGIHLLMADFDNTIVPYTTNIPTKAVERWLESIKASDIRLCVVSNSRKARVLEFCTRWGVACITRARKPFSHGIRACLERFKVKPRECALVGDQIFTDTLGANCAGVQSILVKSIHNHNIWLKLRHVAELPFIMLSKHRGVKTQ